MLFFLTPCTHAAHAGLHYVPPDPTLPILPPNQLLASARYSLPPGSGQLPGSFRGMPPPGFRAGSGQFPGSFTTQLRDTLRTLGSQGSRHGGGGLQPSISAIPPDLTMLGEELPCSYTPPPSALPTLHRAALMPDAAADLSASLCAEPQFGTAMPSVNSTGALQQPGSAPCNGSDTGTVWQSGSALPSSTGMGAQPVISAGTPQQEGEEETLDHALLAALEAVEEVCLGAHALLVNLQCVIVGVKVICAQISATSAPKTAQEPKCFLSSVATMRFVHRLPLPAAPFPPLCLIPPHVLHCCSLQAKAAAAAVSPHHVPHMHPLSLPVSHCHCFASLPPAGHCHCHRRSVEVTPCAPCTPCPSLLATVLLSLSTGHCHCLGLKAMCNRW